MSDSIMPYNAFATDVENLFLLAKDLVFVLGETDKNGKLLDYYPPMRPMKAYDLEGLIPLLCVSWPPSAGNSQEDGRQRIKSQAFDRLYDASEKGS